MLSGKRIILGISGGIAAYKAAILLRGLQKAGAEVRVTMTPDATRFVGVQTFASLSRHQVAVDIFPEDQTASDTWTQHIEWGEWADLFVIAPCTANTLGKIAHGLSDNMLTATVLAARCPLLLCPTMDGEMFYSAAVQQNLKQVRRHGYNLLLPEEGYLASGQQGRGRLPDPEFILDKCSSILSETDLKSPLSGKKVVVTAGPTREFIDPVRFISNPSSGKMGFAMAEAAQKLGAEVTLIHGPVTLSVPKGIKALPVTNAKELFEQVRLHSDAEVIVMAAAVSDFTPKQTYSQKIKKEDAGESESVLELERTADILSWLGKHKRKDQVLIGFAMETENLTENARKKRDRKKVDWIIANSLNTPDSGFNSDTNTVEIIGDGFHKKLSGAKREVARRVLSTIFTAG